jgi:NAD-dependent dihydropyrimidine dehydrogenase PreA subunit
MAYVITDTCTKDELCVDACPVDCIHPKSSEPLFEDVSMLYVDPETCIDCGACIPVCPTGSIYVDSDLPAELSKFAAENAAFYKN